MPGRGGQDVGAILDPVRLGSLRADLPGALQPQFDQAVAAIRLGFATALGDLFLLTALILVVPIVRQPLATRGAPARSQRPNCGPLCMSPLGEVEASTTAFSSPSSVRIRANRSREVIFW